MAIVVDESGLYAFARHVWMDRERRTTALSDQGANKEPDPAKGALSFLLMSRRQVKVQDCLGAKKRTYK